jgi:DNA-binding IclR family transcriptional regulator
MISERPYSGTQAVLRAIALLKTFSDAQPEWNLAQLAQAVSLNKTTAYRLLRALESEGMVGRNRDTGAYRLGPEAIAVGGRALRCNDVRFASHGSLEAMAQQVGEAATLEILVGDQVMVLDEVPSSHLVATWQSVGTRYPAHATSTGKLLLAYLSREERSRILQPPLARLTEHTLTDPEELERELARVQAQGFALASEELESGFVAVRAPVRHHDGQVVAAISVGGPTTRLCRERLEEAIAWVKQAADVVSSRLGYGRTG